jgi:hypothetical protein
MIEQLTLWSQTSKLIYVTYVKPKEGPLTATGRILKIHEDQLLIYDDDQKRVLNLKFNEIDDIQPYT